MAGLRKTDAIKSFIEQSYPYTQVIPLHIRIGDPEEPQKEALEKFIEGVDLIYDATAEYGVQYFISELASEKNIPYICVSTTYGAWGGFIARVLPGRTGCWSCLKYWQIEEGDKRIPIPNQKEDAVVQPKGCADPTFTGASFDGSHIALAGVRHAVSTLSQGNGTMYPSVEWDVVVINFRNESGNIISPEHKTFKLTKHPSCPCKSPA
jgi:molybdopterin/thiamine biosynthesis adenylyltransferase